MAKKRRRKSLLRSREAQVPVMFSSLDTNIIMRYIWRDVPGQREKAIALMDDNDQTFYISDLVISEVIFNLKSAKLQRKAIVGILSAIFEKKNIVVSDLVKNIVLPFYETHPALSFVDCYAAAEAEKKHWEPLWTFDRKLASQHPSAKRAL